MADGKSCHCATLSLDNSGSELLSRLGNQVYELARANKISIPSFPDFSPHLEGLKAGTSTERTQAFKVTAVRGKSLLVLESFAKRWLETESTQERAKEVIAAHNAEFTKESEDYILADRRQWLERSRQPQRYSRYTESNN